MNVLGGENAIDNGLLALKNQYHPQANMGVTVISGDVVPNDKAIRTTAALGGAATTATVAAANVPISIQP